MKTMLKIECAGAHSRDDRRPSFSTGYGVSNRRQRQRDGMAPTRRKPYPAMTTPVGAITRVHSPRLRTTVK